MVETIGSLLWYLSSILRKIYLLLSFEEDQTCSTMVGDLCGCMKDRRESHGGEMEGIQGIMEVTILSHGLQRGTNYEVVVPSVRTGIRSEKIHFKV